MPDADWLNVESILTSLPPSLACFRLLYEDITAATCHALPDTLPQLFLERWDLDSLAAVRERWFPADAEQRRACRLGTLSLTERPLAKNAPLSLRAVRGAQAEADALADLGCVVELRYVERCWLGGAQWKELMPCFRRSRWSLELWPCE